MEVTKESLHDHDIILNEEPQNKCETATNSKIPEIKSNMREDLCTSDATDLKENGMCNLQRDDQSENVDLVYIKANSEILNGESVSENIERMAQLESTPNASQVKNFLATINESAVSGISSSDEEILQTRFSVQNKNFEDEYNIPKTSASFVSISDKGSMPENYSEMKKAPIIIQAKVDNKEKSGDNNSSDPNSEIELAEKNNDQESAIDIANHGSFSIEADNSNMDTESSYVQNSLKNNNQDLPLIKGKYESEILSQDIIENAMNEFIFDQNIEEPNDMSIDFIIEDFFNGTLDTSIFKSEIKSEMIKDENMATKENQLVKDKHSPSKEQKRRGNVHKNSNYNKKRYSSLNSNNKSEHKKIKNSDNKLFANLTDDSVVNLKRKISRKQTENSKKARITAGKNKKDEVTDITSDISNKYTFKPKTRSENRGSKANSQHKQVVNYQPKYNDKSITILNGFDMKEENSKKSRTKNSTTRTKSLNKEKIFKDFSYKITPLKKSRDSRNCSLIASKKIKDIEKLENSANYEEVYLDSDSTRFVFNAEKIEDSYESIFKGGETNQKFKPEFKPEKDKFCNEDTISIASSDSFQLCSGKEEKIKDTRITRSNRKLKSKFEGILDGCRIGEKRKLKDKISKDNFTSETNRPDFSVEENENMYENHDNRKYKSKFEGILEGCRIGAKRQFNDKMSKNNFISETNRPNFLVEQNENMYENHYSNRKKVGNRRQGKSDEKLENKLLKYNKNEDKITSRKNDTKSIMNYGAITRSKRKTWDTLEKELLGESKDPSFSNNFAKTELLKERSVRKQNMKDADIYSISDKSVIQTNMPARRKKYDRKYELQNIESKCLQIPTSNVQSDSNTFIEKIQSNEIVPYKSKNILEKTIAAMEKCTAKFLAPKVNFTEKKSIHNELEFDSMINEMSIDQEAEFHSNMTVMRNKNEQYYKNEIIAVLKQSNSKRNANSCSATRTEYSGGEDKYGFNDAKHLIKRSIITESYSVKNNAEGNHKIESQALISAAEEKQIDPWTKLIKELNLEQNDEKDILNGSPCRKPFIYARNLKQHTNTHPNTDGEIYKQDETENEGSKLEVLKKDTFEEISVLPNHIVTCSDLNVGNNYCSKDAESRRNAVSRNEYITTKMEKTTECKTKAKQTFQTKKVKESPKFKLLIKEDGGVKFKRCIRSLSSSSEEYEKQKHGSTKYDDKNKSKRENYKRYLKKLFEKKDSLSKEMFKKDNRKSESMKEESRVKKNLFQTQTEMDNILIAKDEDDIFSISSSDSETVNKKNKGSGLLCDMFDE